MIFEPPSNMRRLVFRAERCFHCLALGRRSYNYAIGSGGAVRGRNKNVARPRRRHARHYARRARSDHRNTREEQADIATHHSPSATERAPRLNLRQPLQQLQRDSNRCRNPGKLLSAGFGYQTKKDEGSLCSPRP